MPKKPYIGDVIFQGIHTSWNPYCWESILQGIRTSGNPYFSYLLLIFVHDVNCVLPVNSRVDKVFPKKGTFHDLWVLYRLKHTLTLHGLLLGLGPRKLRMVAWIYVNSTHSSHAWKTDSPTQCFFFWFSHDSNTIMKFHYIYSDIRENSELRKANAFLFVTEQFLI